MVLVGYWKYYAKSNPIMAVMIGFIKLTQPGILRAEDLIEGIAYIRLSLSLGHYLHDTEVGTPIP